MTLFLSTFIAIANTKVVQVSGLKRNTTNVNSQSVNPNFITGAPTHNWNGTSCFCLKPPPNPTSSSSFSFLSINLGKEWPSWRWWKPPMIWPTCTLLGLALSNQPSNMTLARGTQVDIVMILSLYYSNQHVNVCYANLILVFKSSTAPKCKSRGYSSQPMRIL